jgi:hypothetical protein
VLLTGSAAVEAGFRVNFRAEVAMIRYIVQTTILEALFSYRRAAARLVTTSQPVNRRL